MANRFRSSQSRQDETSNGQATPRTRVRRSGAVWEGRHRFGKPVPATDCLRWFPDSPWQRQTPALRQPEHETCPFEEIFRGKDFESRKPWLHALQRGLYLDFSRFQFLRQRQGEGSVGIGFQKDRERTHRESVSRQRVVGRFRYGARIVASWQRSQSTSGGAMRCAGC